MSAETAARCSGSRRSRASRLAPGATVGVVDTAQLALERAQLGRAARGACAHASSEAERQIGVLEAQRDDRAARLRAHAAAFAEQAATAQQLDQAERDYHDARARRSTAARAQRQTRRRATSRRATRASAQIRDQIAQEPRRQSGRRHRARDVRAAPASSCSPDSRCTRSPISTRSSCAPTSPSRSSRQLKLGQRVQVHVDARRTARVASRARCRGCRRRPSSRRRRCRRATSAPISSTRSRSASPNPRRRAQDRHAGRRRASRRAAVAMTRDAVGERRSPSWSSARQALRRRRRARRRLVRRATAASCSASSGPTAPARRRSSAFSRRCSFPTRARPRVLGARRRERPVGDPRARRLHARPLLAVSRPERRGEPPVLRVGVRHDARAGIRPHRADLLADRAVPRPPRRRAVRRDEAEARALLRARSPPGHSLSRRADDRRRRRFAARVLGSARRAARRRASRSSSRRRTWTRRCAAIASR